MPPHHFLARNVEMIMFGGVPIMVIMPPKILANARGIGSTRRTPLFVAVFSATGSNNASARRYS